MWSKVQGTRAGRQRSREVYAIGIILILVAAVYYLTTGTEKMVFQVKDEGLEIQFTDSESMSVNFSEIRSMELINSFEAGTEQSGRETQRYQFGEWKNDDFGVYNLCADKRIKIWIKAETDNGIWILNFENRDATEKFCRAFGELAEGKTGRRILKE